jgi:hypothetical protein
LPPAGSDWSDTGTSAGPHLELAFAIEGAKVDSTFLTVPNQLAPSKRRKSLSEHSAVLAALEEIARSERTTVMELLRQAARAAVRQRVAEPSRAEALRALVWQKAPRMPARFKTSAQLARFKRAQREFDQVVLDLQLATPAAVQARNSLARSERPILLLNFDAAHAGSV